MANGFSLLAVCVLLSVVLEVKSRDVLMKYQRLTAFPDLSATANTIQLLDLTGNNISNIAYQDLQGFTVLDTLIINRNHLTQFPNLTAVGSTLERLLLQSNNIAGVSAEDVKPLTVITVINIAYNQLTVYPDFRPLGNTLQYVLIGFNKISHIQATDLYQMEKQTSLGLEGNLFTQMPNLTGVANTLRALYLSHTQISLIEPVDFDGFVYLNKLMMRNSKLTHFPNLTHIRRTLVTLDLSNNQIPLNTDKELANINIFEVMKFLNLSNNQITVFPYLKITGQTLIELDLGDNNITNIDSRNFESLYAIETLNLDGNRLSRIQDVSTPLPNLLLLSIGMNLLSDFAAYNLASTVTDLYIEYNKIERITLRHWSLGATGGSIHIYGNSFISIQVPQCPVEKTFSFTQTDIARISPCELSAFDNAHQHGMVSCVTEECDLGLMIEEAKGKTGALECAYKTISTTYVVRSLPPPAPRGHIVSARSKIDCVLQCGRDQMCRGVFWSTSGMCGLVWECEEMIILPDGEIWVHYKT